MAAKYCTMTFLAFFAFFVFVARTMAKLWKRSFCVWQLRFLCIVICVWQLRFLCIVICVWQLGYCQRIVYCDLCIMAGNCILDKFMSAMYVV